MKTETKQLMLLSGLTLLALSLWSDKGQEIISEGYDMIQNPTRGERNNNPGNIDKGQKWQGLAASQPDSRFASFISPEYGIRALARLLLTYFNVYGLDTIDGIISRWAPSVENNTSAYARAVSKDTGFATNQVLNVSNPDTLFALAKAIIHHENGRVSYSDEIIAQGVQMAVA